MYSCLSVLVNSQKYLVKFLRDLHEEVVVEFYLKWNQRFYWLTFSIEYFLLVAVILTLIISINFCVSKCSLQQALLSHYSHQWPPLAPGKFPEIICFDLSSSSVITIIKPISVDISKSKCIKTKTTRMENCPLSYGVIPSQVTKLKVHQ